MDNKTGKENMATGSLNNLSSSISSSTSTPSSSLSGLRELNEMRKEKTPKPAVVDAETLTTKSLASDTSTTSSASSETIARFNDLTRKTPIHSSTQSLSSIATEDKSQTVPATDKKETPAKIKFQTIPEESVSTQDEISKEGKK